MKSQTPWVYILECADGSFYTGWTYHVPSRLAAHNAGQGAKYTRSRRPLRLIYQEQMENKSAALKREWALKQLSHKQKLALVQETLSKQPFLSKI